MPKILTLTITRLDNSATEVRVLPITRMAFETHFNRGLGTLGDSGRESDVFWLAWDAEKRTGKIVKPFEGGWLEDILAIEMSEEPPPLEEVPTPQTSPAS